MIVRRDTRRSVFRGEQIKLLILVMPAAEGRARPRGKKLRVTDKLRGADWHTGLQRQGRALGGSNRVVQSVRSVVPCRWQLPCHHWSQLLLLVATIWTTDVEDQASVMLKLAI